MPFWYASLVFFLRESLIEEEADLNANVLGLTFKFLILSELPPHHSCLIHLAKLY